MGDTGIEWADEIWNPVTGCTKVSAGCKNCYAERIAHRFWGDRKFTDVQCHPDRLADPLRWRKPRRIFVNSMSDLFHEAVPFEFIAAVFGVMANCPQHTFVILTKRADRALDWFRWLAHEDKPGDLTTQRAAYAAGAAIRLHAIKGTVLSFPWPLLNVEFGVSVEDQKTADERIQLLLQTPAAVRIVSAEPLLSALVLSSWLHDRRRTSVLGAGCLGNLQGGSEWEDLAHSEVVGGRHSQLDLYPEAESGTQFGREGRVSACDVQSRRRQTEGRRTSHRLDDLEPPSNPERDGNQPHRRRQTEQRPVKPRAGHASTERAALSHTPLAEEEGSAGREEFLSRCDRGTGRADSGDVARQGHVATRDSRDVRDHSIHSVCDRSSEELVARPVGIDGVIIGGESGPGARPCSVEWIRSIVRQCKDAGTPVFVKQDSGPRAGMQGRIPDELWIKELP